MKLLLLGGMIAAGIVSFVIGAYASLVAASVNMGWNNPLPRAGCAFLLGGAVLLGAAWGLSR